MDPHNFANTIHNLFRSFVPTSTSDDSDIPPLEAITNNSTTVATAGPPTAASQSEPAHTEADVAMNTVDAQEDEEEMPALQSVSDSEEEDSDEDAYEVEMQAVNDNAWVEQSASQVQPIQGQPIGISSSNISRMNRRARVDDDDDDRDRRHPSQRVGNTASTSHSAPVTLSSLPNQQHPWPVLPPLHPGLQARATPNFPSEQNDLHFPPEESPSITQIPPFRTSSLHRTGSDGPRIATGNVSAGDVNNNNNNGNNTNTPENNANNQNNHQNNAGGRMRSNVAFGGFTVSFDANGSPTVQPGSALNTGGPDFQIQDFLQLFNGSFEEKGDPDRAKKLVDALEEVPIGLVKRLEAVTAKDQADNAENTVAGDCACAICWDKLLDGDGGFIVGEKKEEGTGEAIDTTSQTTPGVSSESTEQEPSSATPKHPKIVSLPCAHVFHATCLLPWFSRPRQTTCPSCRFNIDPEGLTAKRAPRSIPFQPVTNMNGNTQGRAPNGIPYSLFRTVEQLLRSRNTAANGDAPTEEGLSTVLPSPDTPVGNEATPTPTPTQAPAPDTGAPAPSDQPTSFITIGFDVFIRGSPVMGPQGFNPSGSNGPLDANPNSNNNATDAPMTANANRTNPNPDANANFNVGPGLQDINFEDMMMAEMDAPDFQNMMSFAEVVVGGDEPNDGNAGGADELAPLWADYLLGGGEAPREGQAAANDGPMPPAGINTTSNVPPNDTAPDTGPQQQQFPRLPPWDNVSARWASGSGRTVNEAIASLFDQFSQAGGQGQDVGGAAAAAGPGEPQPQGSGERVGAGADAVPPTPREGQQQEPNAANGGNPVPQPGRRLLNSETLSQFVGFAPPRMPPTQPQDSGSANRRGVDANAGPEQTSTPGQDSARSINRQIQAHLSRILRSRGPGVQQGQGQGQSEAQPGISATQPQDQANNGLAGNSNPNPLPYPSILHRPYGYNFARVTSDGPIPPMMPAGFIPIPTSSPMLPITPEGRRFPTVEPYLRASLGNRNRNNINADPVTLESGSLPPPIPAEPVLPAAAGATGPVPNPVPRQLPPLPFMTGFTPQPNGRPHFHPRPPRARKAWTLPPAPGPTLRERIEKREREAGLRCYDMSCGVGPSDEEPITSLTEAARRQLNIRAPVKEREGQHIMVDNVCVHTFHPACLVSAARVALMGEEATMVDGGVEVACSVCRGVGNVAKGDWDEGVKALE